MSDAMKILGESIPLESDFLSIKELNFLIDNPRVYTCVYKKAKGFEKLSYDEKQEQIFKIIRNEPSVKKLIPDIKRHGGLMEHILVRHDNMEVIEGNSRLAAYKCLFEESPSEDWELIPCHIISSLTDEQQTAYLNQIHVKGKTQWSAYEKANMAYVNKKKGLAIKKISELLGESQREIRARIKIIEMMNKNKSKEKNHFSYYEVMIRNKTISNEIEADDELKGKLLGDLQKREKATSSKNLNEGDVEEEFTAKELRDKLPVVLGKKKFRKQYIEGRLDLDEAYQLSKRSRVLDKLRKVKDIFSNIEKKEFSKIPQNELNEINQVIRKIKQETARIEKISKPI